MICRTCIERRLDRPLTPDDFGGAADDLSDPEDQPMGEKDYGVYDSLAPDVRQAIDFTIIEFASACPRKVAAIAEYMYEQAPAPIPALHDWFYMDRIAELIDDGALRVLTPGKDLRFHAVRAAKSLPDAKA
jgi:hypothetical protein